MAKSKRTKIIEIENVKYRFSCAKFKFIFDEYCKNNNITKEELEIMLSDKVSVTKSAVHNWRFGSNGPSTLGMIELISNVICEGDYFSLMEEEIIMEEKLEEIIIEDEKYSELQILSIKRIYDKIISFLHEFDYTGGFTTALWYDFYYKGETDPEEAIYEYVENKMREIYLVTEQEYFYLHKLEIYEKLCEFVYNDLVDTYDGKLGYAYRFEAIPDGHPTTTQDYEKALSKINSIISKCI